MSVRVSAVLMAHPSREHMVAELLGRLDRPVKVVWDERGDRWDTGKRAWQAVDATADWGLVLQDDAVLCRDLVAGVERMLEHVPPRVIVSLYIGTSVKPLKSWEEQVDWAVKQAEDRDVCSIVTPWLCWGLGILMPTESIWPALRWCDRARWPEYDKRIGQFFMRYRGWPVWTPWPSLVDHADVPSLVGHRNDRFARRFIGADKSAIDVDWTRGHVVVPSRITRRLLPPT